MKKISILFVCFAFLSNLDIASANDKIIDPGFMGMWTLSIEDGSVGWLNIHEDQGYLDAEMLWKGGSTFPVSHIYMIDDNNIRITRTQPVNKSNDDHERTHIITHNFTITKVGDHIEGTVTSPNRNGIGQKTEKYTGVKLPPIGPAPDLAKIKYGKKIKLFNGKNLKGWSIIDPKAANCFSVVDGTLKNNPVQEEGHHKSYGNLRTKKEFEDFNLQLEVNVPEGHNSGVYLKGMYEIQVVDSYGKDLDPHNMGALYSRITPSSAAEKPAGEWQTLNITLYQRHVTVILNGVTIIDNGPVLGPTGGAIISDVFAPGPIYLQGDHGNVAYRNVVIKRILN